MFIQEFCNSIATIGLNLNILKIESVPVTPEAMFSGDVNKVGKVWAITKKAMKNDADMEKLDNLIAATQSIMYYGTREALDNDEVTRLQVSASD